VSEERQTQLDAFSTPGSLLKSGRLAQGMSEREAADRLNLMPDYVEILERDDYAALRSPTFARGYVRSYGRLLDIDEQNLLQLFDELEGDRPGAAPKRIETKPLQLQQTGVGVGVGLVILFFLVVLMRWWLGADAEAEVAVEAESEVSSEVEKQDEESRDLNLQADAQSMDAGLSGRKLYEN
jgi:cytoskeletal protein RodZ